jgi:uncharacterized protein YjlB
MCSRDIALHMQAHPVARQKEFVEPEQFRFRDDGVFPNSVLPVLLYRQAFMAEAGDRASVVEQCFAENDWTNSWRNGVYSFTHYHSTTHEVLGAYGGAATLRLGGEHASADFVVVGAYPDGREWDLLRGLPGERPKADHNIAALPIPDNDPIYGPEGPLPQIWKFASAKPNNLRPFGKAASPL